MKSRAINTRRAENKDLSGWAEMRNRLWPESEEHHQNEIEQLISDPDFVAFVAEDENQSLVGFVEASIRKYANGCESSPVPFAEGCWVQPEHHRQGIGLQLIRTIEKWAQDKGYRELCSDCLQSNLDSIAAHEAWGFLETERVVYFRKRL